MERYYTVSQIAQKLSAYSRSRMVSEDIVYGWVRQGKLQVERIPGNFRGVGKYPYWMDESHLKDVLTEMGYDIDRLFPDND
ncbi:hypothetical protein J2Z22_004797 [Paenibacillus forsythiae]|uniref:DNA-binding protein n=1 Tax=Paenibacillus forsythiae TaxID=365616 RepID=A0ABU3HFD7_9BACL|nr:hypothetical protein [Paenibacillus forsythiae]MDT3429196.1 hypothetical protein [Paenibacillus forsythiae]